uniref:Laminin subunit beta-1 n=1 Tax=Macrostomum lignano TaxID=282301 RepID=A0A1I8H8U3_9PLAT
SSVGFSVINVITRIELTWPSEKLLQKQTQSQVYERGGQIQSSVAGRIAAALINRSRSAMLNQQVLTMWIWLACGAAAFQSDPGLRSELPILFPSQGDLLLGREANLNASSTCGEKEPIRVCPRSGTVCFICDSKKSHDKATVKDSYKLENAVGKIHSSNTTYNSWWLSQPGEEHVILELNLENKFTFTHLIMIFRGYRPKAWYLERSSDYGTTYKPYGYFAEKCKETFPSVPIGRRQNIDDVVCSSSYTGMTPSDKGQVVFNSVPQHIHEMDRSSKRDQELWKNQTEITNLRIHLYKFHTLSDESSLKNYLYGLYEINIHGMCICNGHAAMCKPASEIYRSNKHMVHSQCDCMHNTQGPQCEQCLEFYNDRKWAPATLTNSNECRRCQCHGHSDRCVFSQAQWDRTGGISGGQCLDCKHNTTGDHCEKCEAGFYRDDRKTLEDPDTFVTGRRCDRCQPGYWDLQANRTEGCRKCDCGVEGTVGNQGCNQYTGQCPCKVNVQGETCDSCKPGFYNLSMIDTGCTACKCDVGGSLSSVCDRTSGACTCKPGFTGRRCDQLKTGYFVPKFGIDGSVVDISESPDSVRFPRVTRPEESTLTGSHGLRVRSPTQRTPDSLTIPLRSRTVGLPTGRYIVAVKVYPKDLNESINLSTLLRSGLETSNCSQRLRTQSSTLRIPSTKEFQRQQQPTGPLGASPSRPYAVLPATNPVCIDAEGLESLTIELGPVSPADTVIIDAVLIMPNWDSPIGSLLNRTQHTTGRGSVQPEPVSPDTQKAMETSLYNCLDYWSPDRQVASRMPDECRRLVQSLSSYRITGAVLCACSAGGTAGQGDDGGTQFFDCEKLGGQCACLPNVIRRTCSECAPDHYGFGRFPNEGCKACNCSELGSSSTQCDIVSGRCPCTRPVISGRKCDSCIKGYWLFPVCDKCSCNGLAEDCDKTSGDCLNCTNNTGGRECQHCSQGFYGDPKRGIPCRPCRCPGGQDGSVQHATSCYLRTQTPPAPVCNCEPGYIGDSCERCDVNFYGDPSTGDCTRCSCNGNINFSVPNSCDPSSGRCTKCLNYTTGVSCERCRQGFHGQAAIGRCLPCRCYPLGTEPGKALSSPVRYSGSGGSQIDVTHSCDLSSGQCSCLPNVEGTNCDACKPNHYNLTSGTGCTPCDCDPDGSINDMCNVITGQCLCKSNRGGRRCDQCLDLHFGDPTKGCQPCDCHPEGSLTSECNKITGRCVCKSAITGRRCDSCERGTTGSLPNCTTCGECWYSWDKIVTGLSNKSQELQRRSDLVGQTGNIAGELGAIVNETDANLNRILTAINQTQVSVDQVTAVQAQLSDLKSQADNSSIEGRARVLAKQANKTKSDWIEEEDMLRPIDQSNQQHLNPKRRINKISDRFSDVSRSVESPRINELLSSLSQAERTFNYLVRNFTAMNSTQIQQEEAQSAQNEARLAVVVSQVENVNSTAQNQSKSITDIYQSVEKKLPELNKLMCVGDPGESASLYSRSKNYCSELCGGPTVELCSKGGVDIQCAGSSVCDKSVIAQLRSVAENSQRLSQSLSKDITKTIQEQGALSTLDGTARVLNASSTDSAAKLDLLKSEYDELQLRAEQLGIEMKNLLAANGSMVGEVRDTVDSIRDAASVFSAREVSDLSNRLGGLMEKLPREFNVSKIREETRQTRADVAKLTQQADQVMSETQRLQASASGLTEQLSRAQSGIQPSDEALKSADEALDAVDNNTAK